MLNIILKVLFFLVFVFLITPIGIVLRLLGVDYLNQSIDKHAKSYWFKR